LKDSPKNELISSIPTNQPTSQSINQTIQTGVRKKNVNTKTIRRMDIIKRKQGDIANSFSQASRNAHRNTDARFILM
jgi:hypothetical protein